MHPKRNSLPLLLALVAIALVALWTRVPPVAHPSIYNDEQHHHLASWKNRHYTDDVYPLFLDRLEGRLSPSTFATVEKIYRASPIVQHGLIVLVDPQPPLYTSLAELLGVVSGSSLIALRVVSLLASLAAVGLMFVAGRLLWDNATGALAAMLLAVSAASALQAGIGRPYAVAQAAMLLAVVVYLLDLRREAKASPWRVLLAALIAQATQWMLWPLVFPLVATAVWRRWQASHSVKRLLKQTGWYVALSLMLVAYMLVQLQNPTVANQGGAASIGAWLRDLAAASPLGQLVPMTPGGFIIAGLLTLTTTLLGLVALSRRKQSSGRIALLAMLAFAVVTPLLVGTHLRFWMSYVLPFLLVSAVGLRWLCRTPTIACATAAVAALAMLVLYVARPIDPYEWLPDEVRWDRVAAVLNEERQPGDVWLGMPYYWANNLYRYVEPGTPEPPMAVGDEAGMAVVESRPTGARAFVVVAPEIAERTDLDDRASRRWNFDDRVWLLELPAR